MDGFRIAAARPRWRAPSRTSACSRMTRAREPVVAQHNQLMRASGFTVLGPVRLPALSPRRARRRWSWRATGSTGSASSTAPTETPASLPYGEQRRLEIARAMCTEPVLLCLDEPAAGLNPRESAELNALLRCHPRRAQDRRPADRARHERGDGHLRPHRRARLRPQDRRRHARASPQRPGGDPRLSRRGRRRELPPRRR